MGGITITKLKKKSGPSHVSEGGRRLTSAEVEGGELLVVRDDPDLLVATVVNHTVLVFPVVLHRQRRCAFEVVHEGRERTADQEGFRRTHARVHLATVDREGRRCEVVVGIVAPAVGQLHDDHGGLRVVDVDVGLGVGVERQLVGHGLHGNAGRAFEDRDALEPDGGTERAGLELVFEPESTGAFGAGLEGRDLVLVGGVHRVGVAGVVVRVERIVEAGPATGVGRQHVVGGVVDVVLGRTGEQERTRAQGDASTHRCLQMSIYMLGNTSCRL